MRVLNFLLALLGVTLLHVLGVRFITGFAVIVDLFLVLAVLLALEGDEAPSLLGGTAIGLVHDAFSGGAFGLFGASTTVISYLVAKGVRRLAIRDPLPVALVFMIASALYQAMALILASFFLGSVPLFEDTILQVVASGILGLTAFLVRRGAQRRYGLWRHNRRRRLV